MKKYDYSNDPLLLAAADDISELKEEVAQLRKMFALLHADVQRLKTFSETNGRQKRLYED